jgi:GYF domain 2
MNYFLHEGQVKLGPFSYDDLRSKKIHSSTAVWREGLNHWVAASELPEFSEWFSSEPPPFYSKDSDIKYSSSRPITVATKAGYYIGKSLGIVGVLIMIFFAVLYFHNKSMNQYRASNVPSIPFVDPEHGHPSWYLNTQGTYKKNFWGNKEEINGSITNKATHTNYKDVRLKVDFLSQTKTVIASQEYIIYQYVPYGSTQSFSLTLPKPAAADGVGLGIVSATCY